MTTTTTPPAPDTIPMDALRALDACGEARRWLATRTDRSWSAAWRDCERGDWMLWLVGRLLRRDVRAGAIPAHGAPSHRRLVGCLVDMLYALSWPRVNYREEAIRRPVEECLDALARFADGEDVSQETLRVARNRAWAARSAVWSADAAAAATYAADAYAAYAAATYAADADAYAADVAATYAADAYAYADRTAALRCTAEIVRDWYPEAPEVKL